MHPMMMTDNATAPAGAVRGGDSRMSGGKFPDGINNGGLRRIRER
jgi:hypothetical protein